MARNKLRILHVLGTMDPGGVETWLLNVLKYMDRDRFQFDFCTFGPSVGLYAAEVDRLGGGMLRCPKSANLWSFGHRFRRILRERNYDVVHSHVFLFSGTVLRWAKAAGVPIRIAHSHTSHDGKSDTWVRGVYRKSMQLWIDRNATHGLAASRLAAANLFGEKWQEDRRVRVLYYGIDLHPFRQPFVRDEVRRELGIPLEAQVVGHVGRFVHSKNHRFLLEVASAVMKMRPEIHFLFVGDGPLRSEIEARARAMGLSQRILFTGTRTDVPVLMQGSMDIFLFPSLYEGFGLTVVEAQTAGLHCLVSDTLPDEIALSPDAVEFIPLSGGADLWAGRVITALEAPRQDSASVIKRMSQSQLSIQHSVGELASLYSPAQQSNALLAAEYVES